jgi:hypothetical protein
MWACSLGLEPLLEFAMQTVGWPLGRLMNLAMRQVMGMTMPRPMALLNASLAEKRVAT